MLGLLRSTQPSHLGTCSDSLLCPYCLGLNLGPFIQLFATAEQWLDVPSVSSQQIHSQLGATVTDTHGSL